MSLTYRTLRAIWDRELSVACDTTDRRRTPQQRKDARRELARLRAAEDYLVARLNRGKDANS